MSLNMVVTVFKRSYFKNAMCGWEKKKLFARNSSI